MIAPFDHAADLAAMAQAFERAGWVWCAAVVAPDRPRWMPADVAAECSARAAAGGEGAAWAR